MVLSYEKTLRSIPKRNPQWQETANGINATQYLEPILERLLNYTEEKHFFVSAF